MPALSKAQFRAMLAAAAGRSRLNIPKSVGEEFVRKTKKAGIKIGRLPERTGTQHRAMKPIGRG